MFLLLMLLIQTCLLCTDSPSTPITLGEILISARQENNTPDSQIFVMRSDQLEKREELNEFLQDRFSSISSYEGTKGESYMSLRGFDLRNINVLLDGVPVSIPYEGGIDPAKLWLGSIKKIEIVQGAASVMAGPNALGGSINLITDKPALDYGTLDARWFGRKGGDTRASVYGTADDFFYGLTAQYTNMSNFNLSKDFDTKAFVLQPDRQRRLSDKEKSNMYMIFGNRKEDSQMAFRWSGFRENYSTPPDLSAATARYWRFSNWEKDQYSLEGSMVRGKTTWHYNVYSDSYYNMLDSYDDISLTKQTKKYAFTSIYDDFSHGINLKTSTPVRNNGLVNLMLTGKKDVHQAQGTANARWEYYRADTLNAAAEFRKNQGRNWEWTAGTSWSENTPKDADGNNPPDNITATDYTWSFSRRNWNQGELYGNFGHKTRFPSLKERFSGYLDKSIPNPGLEEETAALYAMGYKRNFRGVDWDLTLYSNTHDNAIMQVQLTGVNAGKTQNQNVGEVTYRGFELNCSGRRGRLSWQTGYTYIDAVNSSYSREVVIDYRPLHRAVLNLEHTCSELWTVNVHMEYSGKYHYEVNGTPFSYIEEKSRVLADLEVVYRWMDRQLFARVNNLTDRNYYSSRGYPAEGRNYEFGINVTFN
ncbi:MAG: TonB-dependent receptor [Candidatus Wallbacteria bacterium]|nr:TonB-dependent receptor [Candidatus Wallbacteria bacterium]